MGLDPLFIVVLGMNTDGAGLATMLSQMISFCILTGCTFIGGNMPMKLKRFKLNAAVAKEIFFGGLPSLGRQTIGSVATVLLNFALKPYGDCAIAAVAVVARIMQILVSIIIGFGQGFQPVCGMNYGAEKYDRVVKAFKITVITGTVVLVTGAVVGGSAKSNDNFFRLSIAESRLTEWISKADVIGLVINDIAVKMQTANDRMTILTVGFL